MLLAEVQCTHPAAAAAAVCCMDRTPFHIISNIWQATGAGQGWAGGGGGRTRVLGKHAVERILRRLRLALLLAAVEELAVDELAALIVSVHVQPVIVLLLILVGHAPIVHAAAAAASGGWQRRRRRWRRLPPACAAWLERSQLPWASASPFSDAGVQGQGSSPRTVLGGFKELPGCTQELSTAYTDKLAMI